MNEKGSDFFLHCLLNNRVHIVIFDTLLLPDKIPTRFWAAANIFDQLYNICALSST